jgi:hypothetical protein
MLFHCPSDTPLGKYYSSSPKAGLGYCPGNRGFEAEQEVWPWRGDTGMGRWVNTDTEENSRDFGLQGDWGRGDKEKPR